MAGVQAGRLSIEIVAEIARLQQDLDKAKRAVNAASSDIAKSAKSANDNLSNLSSGMNRANASAGAQRAGMQQLGFQLQDFAVQTAGGTSAVRALAQQLPQAIGAMQLMFTSTSRLGAFFGGPWGVALGVAAAVLLPLIGNLGTASKATDELREAEKRLAASIGALISSREALDAALGRNSQNYITLRVRALEAAQAELTAAQKSLQAAQIRLRTAQADRQMRETMISSNEAGGEGGYLAGLFGFGKGVGAAAAQVKSSAADLNQASATLNNATADLRKALSGGVKLDGATAAIGKHSGAVRGAGRAYSEASKEVERFNREVEQLIQSGIKGFNEAYGQSLEMTSAMLAANTNVDWADMLRVAGENLDAAQKPIRDAAEAQALWNEQLQETVTWLGQIGGFGGKLGGVLQGLSTGNWSGIGGKTGGLLQIVSGIGIGRNGEGIAQTLGDKLAEVFGKDGPFGATLKDVLTGAGIGAAVGGLAFGNNKSAQLGSSLGGAAGQALGSAFSSAFGKLASAAGPLGAIAGSLIGGMLGGLLKKAKTGSATIGVLNGELGIAGVRGNSSSRKAASTQGANSVIDALSTIADAFGASLGTAGVSVGMRNNSYRVDTTGQGRTKGAGVLNFGKDSEAALKAAIADAISDGVFVGLSAGVERLLKNGDVEKQLQKALSFQAVFDDLAAAQDPAKAAQDAITKWHDSMAKIFAEAGATAEELAKLEELTGIKRADAAKAAAEALFEKERPARELNIQIMELEGKTAEALAAARQLELDGMDEALRPMMQRIYALQDEAEAAAKANALAEQRKELETQLLEITDPVAGALARQVDALNALDPSLRAAQQAVWDAKDAADALAESQRLAKEIADERTGLETQWLQLIGDTNALRARERDGISETNRAMYDRIIAEQDRQAAEVEAARIAKEVADAAAVVAKERTGLEDRLLQLQGDTAALRARELAELDPANRALLDRIHALQDEQEAADAAAKAADELAARLAGLFDQRRGLQIALAEAIDPLAADALRRADTLAKLDPSLRHLQQQVWDAVDAQEALAKATEATARIENERAGLLMQWWQATGNTAAIRAAQLAELDASNRGLQQQIWAYQDAQAAAEAMQRARQDEIDSINRTINALGEASGKWLDMAREIREFRAGLFSGTANSGTTYAQSRAEFDRVSRMARLGDQGALNAFTGTARTFLDAALNNASSLVEYQRAIGLVAGAADAAASGAEGVAREAQAQLATLHEQVAQLEALNLQTESSLAAQTDIAAVQTNDVVPTLERMVAEQQSARDEAEQARSEAQAFQVAAVSALNTVARLLSRWDRGDYAAVGNDSDTPLTVGSVTIANTTANPVPVDQVP